MADTTISNLSTNSAPASGDLVETVDVSDTSMSLSGTNKKITLSGLIAFLATLITGLTESQQTLADNTTNDVTTSKHGYVPKAPNSASSFLDGTGAWDTVKDADLSTSDITTNDVSTSKHGFVPKAPNDATKFLDGTGAFDTVKDTDLATTDNTTNDVSTSKHGFAPKGDGSTSKFLNANGAYSTPSGFISTDEAPNTSTTSITYTTTILYPSSNTGFTAVGSTETRVANGVSMQGATNAALHTTLIGRSDSPTNLILFESGIDLKIRGIAIPAETPAGVSPSGAGDKWFFWGFSTGTATNSNADITETTTHRCGFVLYGSNMYTVTCGGAGITTTDLGAYSAILKESLMINYTATNIKFYRNSTLVGTHTTNLPSSGIMKFMIASYNGSGSTIDVFSGALTLSETLN